MRSIGKKIVGLLLASALILSQASSVGAANNEVDLNGTYHARLGIQTCTMIWMTQLNYYKGDANNSLGTKLEGKLFAADSEDVTKLVEKTGELPEIEIKGNGTYTVSINGADFEGEQCISQLHVATDIPLNDKIKFSDVKVMSNGKTIVKFDEGIMEDEEPYLEGGMVLLTMNLWRDQLCKYLSEHGLNRDGDGYQIINGSGNENLSITFTVSGFNYDNKEAVEVTKAPKKIVKTSVSKKKTENKSPIIPIGIAAISVVILGGICIYKKKY